MRLTDLRDGEARHMLALVEALHALDDERLAQLIDEVQQRTRASLIKGSGDQDLSASVMSAMSDPVSRVEVAYMTLVEGEGYRREAMISAAEIDLRGGHALSVGPGNEPLTYSAVCDPDPDCDEFCWQGPDRSRLSEAVADARDHFPAAEPRIVTWP